MKIWTEKQNELALKEVELIFDDNRLAEDKLFPQLVDAIARYEEWKYPMGSNVFQRAINWVKWLVSF